mmetsp:Transcript_14104/g.26413  ORF Transcript_14104/g.26413 Transcript_14104/m.26413 type:complete len:90 (+) Transcript_14104:1858-2127(+)
MEDRQPMFVFSPLGRRLIGQSQLASKSFQQPAPPIEAAVVAQQQEPQAVAATQEVSTELRESSGFIKVAVMTLTGLGLWYYIKKSDFSG